MKSNRPEHLAANFLVTCVLLALVTMTISRLGAPLVLASVPVGCFFGEVWATADRDHPSARLRYWWVYRETIPRHRHPRSHSILPGTIYRFAYGFALPISGWTFNLVDVVLRAESLLKIPAALADSWLPVGLLILLGMLCGMAIGDCTHLAMDSYSLDEWLFGRRKG